MLMELSEEVEITHKYNAEEFNPLRHSFVTPEIEAMLALTDEFPEYLDRESVEDAITGYLEYTISFLCKPLCTKEEEKEWSKGLRTRILIEVESSCRRCKKCDLHKNSPCNVPGDVDLDPTPIFGEGVVDALVMVLAEAGGQFESRTGVPMVGNIELRTSLCATTCKNFEPCYLNGQRFVHHITRECQFEPMETKEREKKLPLRIQKRGDLNTAGEVLDRCLGEAGLMRTSAHGLKRMFKQWKKVDLPDYVEPNVYVTNAVRHHPADSTGANRAPTKGEIQACSAYLQLTIRLVRPKTIVALGAVGLSSLLPASTGSITSMCPDDLDKEPIEISTKYHPVVYPCVHPAYVMRLNQSNPANTYEEKIIQILETAKAKAESL